MPKLTKITPFFIDRRGKMSHLLKDKVSVNSILLISCKKGSIRANHYHKKDNHYSVLLEGEMDYFYIDKKIKKLQNVRVKKGYSIFTPAGEYHAMRFLKDSLFLALTTEGREQKNYEKDTVKVKLI